MNRGALRVLYAMLNVVSNQLEELIYKENDENLIAAKGHIRAASREMREYFVNTEAQP